MSSAYRIKNENEFYYLTLTVRHWIDLFARASFKWLIVDSLNYRRQHNGLKIYAWCLMPSHLHMIVQSSPEFRLSETIRDFKKYTSKKLAQSIIEEPESRREWLLRAFKNNTDGHSVWQPGNHAKECISEEFTFSKIDYIHNNPIQSQTVDRPEAYLFSSARDFIGFKGLITLAKFED